MRILIAMAVLAAAALLAEPCAASAPGIEWERLYGGERTELVDDVQQTADGGYVFAGKTSSLGGDGDVIGTNHGGYDIWVVKTNPTGLVQAQRLIGGSGWEEAHSVRQTADGGYIVLGRSDSPNITEGGITRVNHGSAFSYDMWVGKLGPGGLTQNHLLIGGTGEEHGWSVQQTADGGYILVGYSDSTDGAFSGNHGGSDILVVKLNATGTIDWAKLLGGDGYETAYSVQQTADGGYVLAGSTTSSASGDIAGLNHGGQDVWVVKLDGAGAIVGKRLLGGDSDDIAYSVRETRDGGFVLLGESRSSEYGDVTGANHGGNDYWVVKLDAAGLVEWQHLLGGSGDDGGRCVRQTADGGYILLGTSASADGDVAGPHRGMEDYWAVRLDRSGAVVWDRALGGEHDDRGFAVEQTTDGGYILAGHSKSSRSGDVSGTRHGESYPTWDVWLAKLAPDGPGVLAVPPSPALPTDTDHDGLYDDVNGNGRPDFADVVLYFNQMSWIAANEPVSTFDYNNNDRIDFADLVWLFNRL